MSIEVLSSLLLMGIILAFIIGTPVAFALGGVAMAFGAVLWGPQSFQVIPSSAMGGITTFILLAIPLFIFMGQIILRSGLGEAMFHAMHVIAGRIRGGLAIGVIIVCTMMGAMVGIYFKTKPNFLPRNSPSSWFLLRFRSLSRKRRTVTRAKMSASQLGGGFGMTPV